MEHLLQEQAAAESADSGEAGGAGGLPQVAGAQEARSDDRMTLLLRLRAQTKQQLLEYKSMIDAKLKQASESKLLEIQTEKNKQKEDLDNVENSDKIKTMQQNLQKEIQITTVIQHVFQVTFI
ncbi:Centromere protein H [Sciurus carolinensis]|uniref:Centromere protein H n=1 Tax=Sciurus carolinensis TaxID=30640 RepID=A0AA41SUY4_SCICA|nr:Centromere protein H [Sciurus carolinensis]